LLSRAERRKPISTAKLSRPGIGASLIDLVVDASVTFKWLVPDAAEEDVPAAKALLVDHMEGRARSSSHLFCITNREHPPVWALSAPIEEALER